MKNLFKAIIRPLSIIKMHGIAFFIWISFTLIGGLIGIIVSLFRNALFGKFDLIQALTIESNNGSFYTYSIAMVAGVLSSLFITFVENKKLNFRRHLIIVITFSIFIMFFGGIFYALSINMPMNPVPDNSTKIVPNWKIIVILILSVITSIYSFCISRLDSHPESFKDISDPEKEEELLNNLNTSSNTTNNNKPINPQE